MTDRTLAITAALHEARLQRLEASLVAKAATKPAKASSATSRPEPNSEQNNTPTD